MIATIQRVGKFIYPLRRICGPILDTYGTNPDIRNFTSLSYQHAPNYGNSLALHQNLL